MNKSYGSGAIASLPEKSFDVGKRISSTVIFVIVVTDLEDITDWFQFKAKI